MGKNVKARNVERAKAPPFVFDKIRKGDTKNPDLEKESEGQAFKAMHSGAEADSGSTDMELIDASRNMYRKAVDNSDEGGTGDPALKDR
jgi:hypothetical protein